MWHQSILRSLKFVVTIFSISERQKTRAYVPPISIENASIEYNVNVQYTSSLQQFIRSIGVVRRGDIRGNSKEGAYTLGYDF